MLHTLPTSAHIWSRSPPGGYFSPYSQSYHSFFPFFLCTQSLTTDIALRSLNRFSILTCDTPTDAYSRKVVLLGVRNAVFSHLHHQNPKTPKKPSLGYIIMESLWQIHIGITSQCIKLRCWNSVNSLILPSTWATHRTGCGPCGRGLLAPTLNFGSAFYLGN